MTAGWYTSGSARAGAGGGVDGSGVSVAGASGAGGVDGAGVDAGIPAPAQRTAAVPESAPSDAGTPAPAERTAQVQGKAPGTRVAQRETLGPRAAGSGAVRGATAALGPRSAQQGSPEAVLVYWENLQGKDRQVTVAEPLGQSKTVNPAWGQEKVLRRWSRGNPTRQT